LDEKSIYIGLGDDFIDTWRLRMDRSGTVHMVLLSHSKEWIDTLYYLAFDRTGRLRAFTHLTTPKQGSYYYHDGDFYLSLGNEDEVLLIWETHQYQPQVSRIQYRYSLNGPDISVSAEAEGCVNQEGICYITLFEGEDLKATIVVNNAGPGYLISANLIIDDYNNTLKKEELTYIAPLRQNRVPFEWLPPSSGEWFIRILVNGTQPEDRMNEDNSFLIIINVVTLPKAELNVSKTLVYRNEAVIFDLGPKSTNYTHYQYYLDLGDGTNSGWGEANQTMYSYREEGKYIVMLKVRDERDLESEWKTATIIVINHEPVANITYPKEGRVFLIDDEILIDARNSIDEDNDELTYLWYSNLSGIISTKDRAWITLPHGKHLLTLEVRDGRGEPSIKSVWIQVTERPVAVLAASEKTTDRRTEVLFSGIDSTDDGPRLEYIFDFGDKSCTGWQNASISRHTYSSLGLFKASLMVRDEFGIMSEKVPVMIDVESRRPVGTLVASNPGPHVNEEMTFYLVDAYDPDGKLTFIQAYDGDATIFTSRIGFAGFNYYFRTPGVHYISMILIDNEDEKTMIWAQPIIVTNLPPKALISINKTQFYVDEIIRTNSNLSYDTDGRIVDYEWEIGDGRKFIMNGFDQEVIFSYSEPGIYIITLDVTDNFGAKNSTTVVVTVLKKDENSSPGPLWKMYHWPIWLLLGVIIVSCSVASASIQRWRSKQRKILTKNRDMTEPDTTRWSR
jgi:PKD repeat protein